MLRQAFSLLKQLFVLCGTHEDKSYTYNRHALTEYEATQQQRYIERQIRRWKRENIAMGAAGLDATESAVKVRQWQTAQVDFAKQTGLKKQGERTRVAGFGRGDGANTIAKFARDDILKQKKLQSGGADVRVVGKIDIQKFSAVTRDIQTDTVIITEKQIEHIRARHPSDFERFERYLPKIIEEPDYILRNELNTGLMLKKIEEEGQRFQLALRLKTSDDPQDYKNSVITFMKIREKEWNRLLRNKEILYRRE